MKKYLKKRVVVLSLAMAAMLALPTMASAQESRSTHGGMFGTEPTSKQSPSLLGQGGTRDGNSNFGLGNQAYGSGDGNITNEPYGAPVGGGIAILLGAGLGYAALKRRKED